MTSLPVCLPLRCHGNTSINSHHWLGHTHSNSLSQLVDVPIFQYFKKYFPHICLLPENTQYYEIVNSKIKQCSVQILNWSILLTYYYLFRNGLLCVLKRVEGGRDSLKKNEECLRNWFFSLSSVCDEGRWMVGHLAMASPVVNSTSRLRFMITTTTKKGSITWWVLQMTGHRHLLGKQN